MNSQTNPEECAGRWKRRRRQQLASSYCQRDKKQACGSSHVDSSTVGTRSGRGGRLLNLTCNTHKPSICPAICMSHMYACVGTCFHLFVFFNSCYWGCFLFAGSPAVGFQVHFVNKFLICRTGSSGHPSKTNNNQPLTNPGQHLEKFSMDQIVLRDFFTFSCFFLGPSGPGAERGAASTIIPLSCRI